MKKVSFHGTDKELIREIILRLMKVKKSAIKVTDFDEADVVVLENNEIENRNTGDKEWVIVPGTSKTRESNILTLSTDTWRESLIATLEDIALDQLTPFEADTSEQPAPVQSPVVAEAPELPVENPVSNEPLPTESNEPEVALEETTDLPPPDMEPAQDTAPDVDFNIESCALTTSPSCEDKETISRQLENAPTFNPHDSPMLGVLQQKAGTNLSIEFDDHRSITIVENICYLRIGKNALKALCHQKSTNSWKIQELKQASAKKAVEELLSSETTEVISMEKLLWSISHCIAAGRRATSLDPDTKYSLGHYPDLNRVEASETYIKMAAILHEAPTSMTDLAQRTDADVEEINDFLFALQTGGFLGNSNHSKLQTNNNNAGVMRKLMHRFSRKKD